MDNLSKEYGRWLRVMILIDYGGRQLCHDILFNQQELPKNGVALQKELLDLRNLNYNQREKVCPSNGEPTDYNTFDVTLLTDIIKAKFGGRYRSVVGDLKYWRNEIFHRGNKGLSINEFRQLWKNISDMLQYHGFNLRSINLKSIRDLEVYDIILHQEYRHIIEFILEGTVDMFLLVQCLLVILFDITKLYVLVSCCSKNLKRH